MKRYTDLLLMDKDEVGNKSLGVVKVHKGFQAVELDDTTEGENSAEEKESENRAPRGGHGQAQTEGKPAQRRTGQGGRRKRRPVLFFYQREERVSRKKQRQVR